MAGLGRADEVVVADVEVVPGLAIAGAHEVGVLPRGVPGFRRGAGDLEAVLVRPGEEEHVVAEEPAPAAQRIRRHGGVGMTDIRGVGDVVDRCRGVEAAHLGAEPNGLVRKADSF